MVTNTRVATHPCKSVAALFVKTVLPRSTTKLRMRALMGSSSSAAAFETVAPERLNGSLEFNCERSS